MGHGWRPNLPPWCGPTLVLTIDWATVASFATALGTLVLAIATFAAVRSANRSARVAEAAFQVNLRPVLVTSRLDDPVQKIRWVDDHWAHLEGSQASVELVDGIIYLAISLRNVGSGLAVPFGWSVMTELASEPRRPARGARGLPHADARSLHRARRHRVLAGRHPGGEDPDYGR